MDILDRVSEPARDLLRRVDSILLAAGAPADHVIWPLLRRAGALPGDVVESFVVMRPAPLRASARELRSRADQLAEESANLASAVAGTEWRGDAAEEFGVRWRGLSAHLGTRAASDEASLAGRLAAMASYVDSVASWMDDARQALARTLGDALSSAEAVRLRDVPAGVAGVVRSAAIAAAAAIAADVLQTALEQLTIAEDEHTTWVGRLDELPFRQSVEAAGHTGKETRVAL
jgi:uncharacterized protein YukE